MSTVPQRAVAVTTVVLALAIVTVLLLRSLGVPLAVGPLATPTPPAATPTPQPTPISSADALAVFSQIEQQVSDLRDLAAPDIGPPDVISRDELAVELEAVFDETWTDEQLADDNLTLRAMGLLTEEQDIRELTEQLYAGQVLGFYDFEDQRMVVVTDTGLTAEARVTYAHEFTHAMQDAAFDTGAFHEAAAEDDDDAALARLALEEGDAVVAMFQWAFGNLAADELGSIGATPLPDMSAIPSWMVRQLEFPYLTGSTWVSSLWASGGWDAVNAAYDQPPASTEQVLHPEKYLSDEAPAEVANPDVAALLGTGWSVVESSTVGEAMLGIWLGAMNVSQADADVAAAGWGGDGLSVARGPGGEWAMAWRIGWDTTAQADEFAEAYADITIDLPFPTRSTTAANGDTLILHASSATSLDRMADALGG